jgi:hypothetical protein
MRRRAKSNNENIEADLFRQFSSRYRTDDDCWEAILRLIDAGCAQCRYCGNLERSLPYGRREIQCKNCRKVFSRTTGTFFDHCKKPFPWLCAIYMYAAGFALNANRLHHLTGVAYASARKVIIKLHMMLADNIQPDGFQAHSAEFAKIICRRSAETPQRQHPRAEIINDVDEAENDEDYDEQPADETQRRVLQNLRSREPTHFDVIADRCQLSVGELSAILVLLELDGFVERQPGERYRRAAPKKSKPTNSSSGNANNTVLDDGISFIKKRFNGISRKYLQTYLAAFSFCQRVVPDAFNSLLQLCTQHHPISTAQMRHYVSPQIVCIG